MSIYKKLVGQYTTKQKQLNKKRNLLSLLRAAVFCGLIGTVYLYLENQDSGFLFFSIGLLLSFLYLLWLSQKNETKRKIIQTFITINNEEIVFLSGKENPFHSGKAYIDNNHLYASDLDIFGENSLFQYLNRTRTYIGEKMLAEQLLMQLPTENIIRNQEAIKELSPKVEWRQRLQMRGILSADSKEKYDALLHWASKEDKKTPSVINLFSYFLPSFFIVVLLAFIVSGKALLLNVLVAVFFTNFFLFLLQYKKITQQSLAVDKIYQTLKGYNTLFEHIEKEQFVSLQLRQLQAELEKETKNVSQEIKRLSLLFSNAESLHNVVAAFIFNGILLFHLHNFRHLNIWKRKNGKKVANWLRVLGEFEILSSLANFSYNNPNYIYPTVNDTATITFTNLGHPLIKKKHRVCNNLSFQNHELIILTGSNMSGKSTLLRAVGINMVLATTGSPVCATTATLRPIKPVVSMRQNDSLSAGESYFFAEIKRLKRIIEELKNGENLVLLDEILRGTNYDDKRNGTEKIINKLITIGAVGIIATHDLKICNIAEKYPLKIKNKHFGVTIDNDKLIFSYKLVDGVCQSKNATFLMNKMGVI